MIRSAKFWIPMAAFQVVFGLVVFTITRQYYLPDAENVSSDSTAIEDLLLVWPGTNTGANATQSESPTFGQSTIEDPVELARQADEFFAAKQYSTAADLYEQLLAFGPDNVDTYNNLGITLHFLGRSAEALRRLNEGVAVDPNHQRIWLTLGFVNSQIGDIEQARAALTNAARMDADNDVGQSAASMLEDLP